MKELKFEKAQKGFFEFNLTWNGLSESAKEMKQRREDKANLLAIEPN